MNLALSMRKLRSAVAIAAVLGGSVYWYETHTRRPKNVILITLDGLRQDHLSFNGYPRTTSRNLDWMAANGTSFSTIIATGSSTKSSLTSLLTSLRFTSHGLINHDDSLPTNVTTLAEVFAQHGYRTAGFTATPMLAKSMGYGRGFQHYEDFTTSRMDYVRAETVVNAALNWIRSVGAHDKYFLYMHFEEPHPPWNRECPWCDRSDPAEPPTNCTTIPPDALFDEEVLSKDVFVRNYDGAIWYADNQVGRLLNAIKERGDLDDTVIAVSADHGYELLDRYEIGHGRNPFDEVVKVPLILYGDGTRSSAKQAAIIDIGPTILGSVGIAKPEGFEGRDLIRSGFEQDPVAFTQGYGVVSARTNRYKLVEIRWDDDVTRPRYVKAYGFQLFDLQEDKGELTDAKDKYPREFESLKRELLEYSKMVVEVAGKAKRRNKNLDKETLERLRALGYIK